MKTSFDHTTDYSFRELNKFLKKTSSVPSYIEEAPEVKDYQGLPKEAFADQGNRAFPKNTKADTYLSYVHFLNKKSALKEKYNESYVKDIENKLKKSAELFNITEDLNKYAADYTVKEASDYSEKIVFEKKLENGNTLSFFNYKTAQDLKYAAEQFAKDYTKIPFDWRFDISKNFVKAANELNLEELPDIICKYAGLFYVDPNHIKTELTRRGRNSSEEFKANYEKLAEQVDDCDTIDDFMKIAQSCYYMEKMQGIYDNYKTASTYGDPVSQIFSVSIDKLASVLEVVKLGNEYFKISDLQNVKPEIYKQAFGDEEGDLDTKNAEDLRDILPTMPLSDVALFKELSGIRAV